MKLEALLWRQQCFRVLIRGRDGTLLLISKNGTLTVRVHSQVKVNESGKHMTLLQLKPKPQ